MNARAQKTSKGAPPYTRRDRRPLQIYAFDPTLGRKLNNYMTLDVMNESVEPGPIGNYLAVIDYDSSNDCYYVPVNLDDPAVLVGGGLDPSESDPRFHQQMVYAVAMETIRRFEYALGRPVKWRADRRHRDALHKNKLLVLPHAFQQANAFYDSGLRALLFGYFPASADDVGENLPGQTIFTCLSHDIVAHETTHALVDGLRAFFMESTNADVPAFHEAFADIVALFQHFSYREALLDTIQRTGGYLYRDLLTPDAPAFANMPVIGAERSEPNPLVGLAKQFGEAIGMRRALRSAVGTKPDPALLATTTEPHLRGAILVAAVFDAFFSMYVKRTRDLMRIAHAGGARTESGELHADLAQRLALEASKLAQHFLNIVIRSLDYAPPVDIRFGEFLRAIITADADLVPNDDWDYRGELIKAFRLRGIIPEDVSSYSEEALKWCGPVETDRPVPPCRGLNYDFHRRESDDETEQRQEGNARILNSWGNANRVALGLDPDPAVHLQAHSFQPIHRVGPDGQLMITFVVEFVQTKELPLLEGEAEPTFKFRGGATVIFDHRGGVRYVVEKSLGSTTRLQRTRDFLMNAAADTAMAGYDPFGQQNGELFRRLHRGY